jgi:hypothetical protein
MIAHRKAGVQFLKGPRRRETAGGHRLFDENGQLKTERQMAAARAEQSEQRERDECEFHLVPRWTEESKQTLTLEIGIERQGRTDLNTVLKEPRRLRVDESPGLLCAQAGRPIRPIKMVTGNWYLSRYGKWCLSG